MDTSRSACEVASSYLEANRDSLVECWIAWLKSRVRSAAVSALPERAIRNHIPPILGCVARYLEQPAEITRQELFGHLKLHGQIRRDQGYTLQELLAEFDGLAQVVTQGINRAIERADPDYKCYDRLEAATRLAYGLRCVSFIAAGTYASVEIDQARSAAGGHEEILRAIAHELSNPLSSISLNLELFELEMGDEAEVSDQIRIMEAAVNRAKDLLETIRTVAVAEGARARSHMISVTAAVHDLRSEFNDSFIANEVKFRITEQLPDVCVETTPFYVVMSNLITNAIKYADKSKSNRWVAIDARFVEEENDSGFCDLRVSDNGVGIEEEFLARVFQRGFRAHPDISHGTGLGLHLAQRALLVRGGKLTIESELGFGTTVYARLRCLPQVDNATSAGAFNIDNLIDKVIDSSHKDIPNLPVDSRDQIEKDLID